MKRLTVLCSVLTLTLALGAPGRSAMAAEPGSLPEVGGYLEESLGALTASGRTTGYLLSHLRLRVGWQDEQGASVRGEFDLTGEATPDAVTTSANVDRLYLRLVNGDTQTTIGRQRISWGNGSAFAPADFFNPPNPLDPAGPRRGADGILVRRAFGEFGYAAAAAAFVSSSGSAGGLSGSVKAGTHLGKTDLDLGWGYDAVSGDHLAFLEARGDLVVGWHASLARRFGEAGEKWSGAGGVDYSFAGGQVIGSVEYAAGPLAGDVGFNGLPREDPRWVVGATYAPTEVESYGAHILLDTASGAPSTAVLSLARSLTSSLDLSVRLAVPFGANADSATRGGEAKVRYSF